MAGLAPEREETLGEFLASRARRVSDGRLAGQAITAVVAAVAIAFWRGPLWDMRLAVAACLLAYGMWGVADRDLSEQSHRSRPRLLVLRSTRLLAAILGFGAAAYFMMAFLGRALGRIIS